MASLAHSVVPIESLHAYPGNARLGDLAAISQSLKRNGLYRPIVVNRRTQQILAGNHTWRAAKELGWTEIAVTYVDVDEDQARRVVLADNRTNDLAGYDEAALAELLGDLPNLEGTGYDQGDLDRLLDELGDGDQSQRAAAHDPHVIAHVAVEALIAHAQRVAGLGHGERQAGDVAPL